MTFLPPSAASRTNAAKLSIPALYFARSTGVVGNAGLFRRPLYARVSAFTTSVSSTPCRPSFALIFVGVELVFGIIYLPFELGTLTVLPPNRHSGSVDYWLRAVALAFAAAHERFCRRIDANTEASEHRRNKRGVPGMRSFFRVPEALSTGVGREEMASQ